MVNYPYLYDDPLLHPSKNLVPAGEIQHKDIHSRLHQAESARSRLRL